MKTTCMCQKYGWERKWCEDIIRIDYITMETKHYCLVDHCSLLTIENAIQLTIIFFKIPPT
jgi:hypothetical protein